jgi:hypothetical protein
MRSPARAGIRGFSERPSRLASSGRGVLLQVSTAHLPGAAVAVTVRVRYALKCARTGPGRHRGVDRHSAALWLDSGVLEYLDRHRARR